MNGDVGSQWLALYAVKNEIMEPILASSLKVVTNSTDLPEGYTTGIHMFGSSSASSAFNLNSKLYDWNQSAPSVFVYYQTDSSPASSATSVGSNSTTGSLALAGIGGMLVGAAGSVIITKLSKKKETSKA